MIGGQNGAGRHFGDHIERARPTIRLGGERAIVGDADRRRRVPAGADQLGQFRRLERKGAVHPTVGAGQSEMLFDDARAKRHRRHRHRRAGAVIRQANHAIQPAGEVHQRRQMRVGGWGWIGRHAMQNGQIARARRPRGGDRRLNFQPGGHAGGNDQRPAGGRDPADQRQIDNLRRGDFVSWRVKAAQQVHGGRVEGRRKHGDADLAPQGEQGLVPFPRRRRLAVEVEQTTAGPQPTVDYETGPVMVDGQSLGGIGL